MKKLILALSVFVMAGAAQAGSKICSGPNLYYSSVYHDFGIQPLPGTELGTTTIVYKGETVLRYTQVSGLGLYKPQAYGVHFDPNAEKIASYGNMVAGSSITKEKATLVYQNPDFLGQEPEVIAEETVICQNTWAMVP